MEPVRRIRNGPSLPRPGLLRRAALWTALASARIASPRPALGATSAALCTDPVVAAALGAVPDLALPGLPAPLRIAGWGGRASGRRASRLAKRTGAELLLLEDGFLRSARREDPPLSVVVDDLGLYSDASRASRLEALIAG